MKMYNEEGSEVNVDNDQVNIFFEAGWSTEKIEKKVEAPTKKIEKKVEAPTKKIEESSEKKEPVKPKKSVGAKKSVAGNKKIHIKSKDE